MNELISDEVAKKIIEEANKECSKCKELNCEECEYRFWRTDGGERRGSVGRRKRHETCR